MGQQVEYFWPITTGLTFFDVWSLAHIGFWLFVGSSLWALQKLKLWTALLICMGVAFAWELFEHFIAFPLWPDRWLDPESWVNSWISDPLTCLISVVSIWLLLDHRRRRKELT